MNTIIWGLNEHSIQLIDKKVLNIDFVFDKNTNKKYYKEIKIINNLEQVKNITMFQFIISSTTYFFDIKREIKKISPHSKVEHISEFLKNGYKIYFIDNLKDLETCELVNSCIQGRINLESGLVIQSLHNIPVSINVDKNATLNLNNNVLMDGVEISARVNANISLGSNTYINKFGIIRAKNSIEIGSNCAIAWNVTIMDNDGYLFDNEQLKSTVLIASNVWIGNNVNILKNTKIPEGCVIGSMSKVKGEFIKNCLIAGNPAVKVKENVKWK